MKRAMPWGDEEDNSSSSSSSSLDTDTEAGDGSSSKKPKNNSAAVAQGIVVTAPISNFLILQCKRGSKNNFCC